MIWHENRNSLVQWFRQTNSSINSILVYHPKPYHFPVLDINVAPLRKCIMCRPIPWDRNIRIASPLQRRLWALSLEQDPLGHDGIRMFRVFFFYFLMFLGDVENVDLSLMQTCWPGLEDCCNFLRFKGHHNLHVRYTKAMHKLNAANRASLGQSSLCGCAGRATGCSGLATLARLVQVNRHALRVTRSECLEECGNVAWIDT